MGNVLINEYDMERHGLVLWDNYLHVFRLMKPTLDKAYGIDIKLEKHQKMPFINAFGERCRYVYDNYMHSSVEMLDRHKVSAIAVVEFIRANLVSYDNPLEASDAAIMPDCIIALQTGFAYMQQEFNALLNFYGLEPIDTWDWPTPLTCPSNSFFAIMARHLYFTKNRRSQENEAFRTNFNELDLAERMYMVEWLTITNKNIEWQKLISDTRG